jgi:HEAT repeat protein
MRLPRCWLGVCLLVAGSAAGAQEPRVDPVDFLWQTLRAPADGPAARDAHLRAAVGRLRNSDELLRALLLTEWRDHDLDEGVAAVDARNRAAVVERFERALRTALHQNEPEGSKAAIQTVGSLDVRLAGQGTSPLARAFTGDLVELTRSGPAPLRELAARTLGRMNAEPGAAGPALGALLNDPDPHLRAVAAESLVALIATALRLDPSRIGHDGGHEDAVRAACAAVAPAAGGLVGTGVEVRRRCGEVLAGAAETLAALAGDAATPEEVENWTAYQHGVEQERTALQPLAAALRGKCAELTHASGDSDAQVRLLARRALENVAEARVRLLRRAASALAAPDGEGDPASGHRSAAYLQDDPFLAGLREALPALTAGVEDPDVKGRRAAIDVLEAMGRQAASAAPALVNALSDRDRFVRWSAARALGKVRPANADPVIAALARLLADPDGDLRLAAAAALGAYGPGARAALPALVEAAKAREPELRLAALRALESIGSDDSNALAVLSAALGDSDGRVRQAAADALQKVAPSRREAVDALLRPR